MLQWIATIVNVVRAGQRLESTEPLTVGVNCDRLTLMCLHSASYSILSMGYIRFLGKFYELLGWYF